MKNKRPVPAESPDDSRVVTDGVRTPLDWPRETGRLDRVMEAIAVRKCRQRRRRMQFAAGGASTLLIAGIVWISSFWGVQSTSESPNRNEAIVLTPERRILPDGSEVELRDGSEISVDFDSALRRVVLRKGEAHFQVKHNAHRTFVVEAGGMEFRAVGTAFAVQLGTTIVDMLVTEGRVAVERARNSHEPPKVENAAISEPLAIVEVGNIVAVDIATAALITSQTKALSSAEANEKLAWRATRLELNDTPLAVVITAINRHGGVLLELGDAELGKVEISGRLRADNVETLLRTLESNYGIQADRQQAEKIVLRKSR